ncbi:AAA family ATPase [bacterium]|nr:AAA family ATPase [bacterium]
MIFSYLDTLLSSKLVPWSESFLETKLVQADVGINELTESEGADHPSRALELFRLGIFRYPISSKRDEGYDKLRNDESIFSDFGYICYLVSKAYQANPENIKLKTAFSAIQALGLISLFNEDDDIVSVNTIFSYLVKFFNVPDDQRKAAHLRYLSAAMFCELDQNKVKFLDALKNKTLRSVRILNKDKSVASSINNFSDLKNIADRKLSLTNIAQTKGSLYFIGDHSQANLRGIYFNAALDHGNFLDLIYKSEFVLFSQNQKSFFKDKNVLDALKQMFLVSDSSSKSVIEEFMKKLKEGCIEALGKLAWATKSVEIDPNEQPENIIYFGAPGTGKSHIVENLLAEISEDQKERVTFHPDFDNSMFVGCFKPITEGDSEEKIKYKFVPQAFTNIYVKAWKNPTKTYYLVIEEINRGNCAEIFGDIFQLLDRKNKYSLTPSNELKDYLEKVLGKDQLGIANGKIVLPSNLNFIATMNTSDQSLFPMDSAFKRRWTMKYVPINYLEKNEDGAVNESFNYEVQLKDNRVFRWIDFISSINQIIEQDQTLGADKCIGNYFVQAKNNKISYEQFIQKVISYLWTDVFKDNESSIFESGLSYNSFFPLSTNGHDNLERILLKLQIAITQK